jgi:hypothetical protein
MGMRKPGRRGPIIRDEVSPGLAAVQQTPAALGYGFCDALMRLQTI